MRNTFKFLNNPKLQGAVGIMLFLLTSSFEFKIILVLLLFLLFLKRIQTIRKVNVFFILFGIWAFAFIYAPYWHFSFRFPLINYLTLFLLFFFGLFWAYFASSQVNLAKVKIELPSFGLLAVLFFIVNNRALSADIPYRGDEDYFINRILDLIAYFNFFWQKIVPFLNTNPLFWVLLTFSGFLILCLITYHFGVRKRFALRYAIGGLLLSLPPLSAAVFFPMGVFKDAANNLTLADVFRYPFFQKWLNLAFVLQSPYVDIALYRAIPFLSSILISWFLFYELNNKLKNKLLSLLISLALVTSPLLLFYSSILYLEMPLIAVIFICTFNLKTLIRQDLGQLKSKPVWYLLLLAAFLKETAIIFLIVIIGLRALYRLKEVRKTQKKMKTLLAELKVYFLILAPLLIYSFFRIFASRFRPYGFQFKNILVTANYSELANALAAQVGFLVLLGVFGLYFLYKKDRFLFKSLVFLLTGIILFFLGDDIRYGGVGLGYSRWNLFLLPMVIFASFFLLTKVTRAYQIILLFLLLLSNVVLYPFKSDGTRLPNWGSRVDIAEYIYPYEEATLWLKEEVPSSNLIHAGHYSPYTGLRFYFGKYKFNPKISEHLFATLRFDKDTEFRLLQSFFQELNSPETQEETILYHSVNNIDLDPDTIYAGQFKVATKIENSLHSLYILKRE